MLVQLREILEAEKGTASAAAEPVAAAFVQKDQWQDIVLLQLTSTSGIPYTFALPSRNAAEIADRLKIESSKGSSTGNA